MKLKRPTVSVIIPVYNEEDRIFDCLTAITNQTVQPLEIIVVDNNSSDQTVVIAERFTSVTIEHESKQGISFARNKGFTVAHGAILARIDADTIVANDWIEQIEVAFTNKKVQAITGFGHNRSGLLTDTFTNTIWNYSYFNHMKAFLGINVLWGANMAIRKSAWLLAEPFVLSNDVRNHEDQDLSLALAAQNIFVTIDPRLVVSIDFGGMEEFGKFWHYLKVKHQTRADHKKQPSWPKVRANQFNGFKRFGFHIISTPGIPVFGFFCAIKSSVLFVISRSYVIWPKFRSEP